MGVGVARSTVAQRTVFALEAVARMTSHLAGRIAILLTDIKGVQAKMFTSRFLTTRASN